MNVYLAGVLLLVVFELAVWTVAFKLQRPSGQVGIWGRIDRNIRIVGANVSVIAVNVGIYVVAVIVKAVT